jgi:hypothetical protein
MVGLVGWLVGWLGAAAAVRLSVRDAVGQRSISAREIDFDFSIP